MQSVLVARFHFGPIKATICSLSIQVEHLTHRLRLQGCKSFRTCEMSKGLRYQKMRVRATEKNLGYTISIGPELISAALINLLHFL
jgi:hypothetical protein